VTYYPQGRAYENASSSPNTTTAQTHSGISYSQTSRSYGRMASKIHSTTTHALESTRYRPCSSNELETSTHGQCRPTSLHVSLNLIKIFQHIWGFRRLLKKCTQGQLYPQSNDGGRVKPIPWPLRAREQLYANKQLDAIRRLHVNIIDTFLQ
jgi:hypothetical protein